MLLVVVGLGCGPVVGLDSGTDSNGTDSNGTDPTQGDSADETGGGVFCTREELHAIAHVLGAAPGVLLKPAQRPED